MVGLARRFLPRYRRYLVIGPAAKLLEVVFDLCVPIVVARMVDEGVALRDSSVVLRLGALLGVMAVAGLASTLVCQKMAALTSQGVGTDLRRELFSQVNRLSYADLDHLGCASLVTRITNDVNQLQVAVAMLVRQVIRWPFLAIGSMLCALAIDVRLGRIFVVLTPAIALVFLLVMRRCIPYFRSMQAKLDRVATICREALSGARVIRAFVREDHEDRRFERAAADQAETAIAAGRLSSLLNPATLAVMDLGVVAILWVGGARVDLGDLTQGEVMAFVNYLTQMLLAIVYVANLVVIFTKASASASRVSEVLDLEPGMHDGPGVRLGASSDGCPAVELDHVSFGFAGSKADALEDVSVRVPRGGTLGVIGGTGSGKSCLANLVPRLYDACEGSVRLFGHDVRDYRLDELRSLVGVVPQDVSLLSGTVRSNLLWRDAEAGDSELWEALETAQAADFVRARPEGLDMPVSAGGLNLSGGQRQRITIARALVGGPSVLVLDDASSALDFATDAALRHALRSSATPFTCVMISQRISTVRDADLILVLDAGRVSGLGSHDQLVRDCPVYAELAASQLGVGEVR
ncbi:MAG: ABC transporter ATP-binding protein [Atopobiaceae bacterium]|nr:ABC transporter ATP-binding protein [Atopobiaceae bacterium]